MLSVPLETTVRPVLPVDLPLTLGPLRRGNDPAMRRDRSGAWWRATLTPDGPASIRYQQRGSAVAVRAWGPGAAWCLETRAWGVLTAGDYRRAIELSQGAQTVAPRGSSAHIQATAQEGRAWARMGDRRRTREALDRMTRLVGGLPVPDRPERTWSLRGSPQHRSVAG